MAATLPSRARDSGLATRYSPDSGIPSVIVPVSPVIYSRGDGALQLHAERRRPRAGLHPGFGERHGRSIAGEIGGARAAGGRVPARDVVTELREAHGSG